MRRCRLVAVVNPVNVVGTVLFQDLATSAGNDFVAPVGAVQLDAGKDHQQFTFAGEYVCINGDGQRRDSGVESGEHLPLACVAGCWLGFWRLAVGLFHGRRLFSYQALTFHRLIRTFIRVRTLTVPRYVPIGTLLIDCIIGHQILRINANFGDVLEEPRTTRFGYWFKGSVIN
jgi:hypothetical protein